MSPFRLLADLVSHYGYPGLALLVGVEGFGVPAPGQTAIVLAAGYASHGRLSVVAVAATAFLAAVAGDSIGYLIGRHGGLRLSAAPVTACRWTTRSTCRSRSAPRSSRRPSSASRASR